MNNEKKGAIGLLFIFLVITVGVLAHSLPSNVYSPQKESLIEVSLMDYSSDTKTLFIRSHIFLNLPMPTNVTVKGIAPSDIRTTQPPAGISDGSARWSGVFSKRSQLYFEDETYASLYYETFVPFENPISVTLEFEGDAIRANIVNIGDTPIESIFVNYNDGEKGMPFSGYLPNINVDTSAVLQLDNQELGNHNLINIMENAGISNYAAQLLFRSGSYDSYNILFVPEAYDSTWAMVAYQLPESLYNDVMPITINPTPKKIKRFGWVLLNLDGVPMMNIENKGTTTIIKLDEDHHHLGDDIDPALVPNEPEGVSYSTSFVTDFAVDSAELVLTTKNIVPRNASTGQFQDNVYVNGKYIGKLNDYVINDTQDYNPRTVSIPFDSAILSPFENTIEITSGANSEGTNYDDLEFYNLKVVIYWDKPMQVAIPEPIPEPRF